jgi:hypothetical protein
MSPTAPTSPTPESVPASSEVPFRTPGDREIADDSVPFALRPVRTRDKLLGVAIGATLALTIIALTYWRLG